MPYFISDSAPGCDGWATVKDDGEILGCHATKQAAIDQMVAVSIAEGLEPGGERVLPLNYRPALADDVPEGRACGNCVHYDDSRVQGDLAYCEKWDAFVSGAYYCNSWQARSERRQVDIRVPMFIRDAAAEGLDWYREGLAGEGVVPRTVREARDMARGVMSEDKVVRANAWAARHAVDLQPARNSDRRDEGFPGPGAVAHALWGINPSDPRPARAWLERTSAQIKDAADERTSGLVIEKRVSTHPGFELREDGDGMTFTGYAAVFDVDSEPLPFIERIRPGAFRRTLRAKNNIRMFINHDPSNVLATVRSRTLTLEEDNVGLLATARLPNTTAGRDIAELMRTRVVDSMSFGFTVARNGDEWSADGMQRTLREVRLHEVSIVTGFPAYPQTTATVRSLEVLAEKGGTDADALAVALTDLEGGQPSPETVELLNRILASFQPAPVEPEPPAATVPVSLLMKVLEHQARV